MVGYIPPDPHGKPLNFTCREYMGSCVYKPDAVGTPLLRQEDVQEGTEIWVPSMFTGGYYRMIVERDEKGTLCAKSDQLLAVLGFDTDDRHAWTCGGLINMRGIAELYISR